MEVKRVPKSELDSRMERFLKAMDTKYPEWEICTIIGDMSMYYLTGTICDGMLLLRRGKDCVLWVRRSYERAIIESEFSDIRPMKSFREIAEFVGAVPSTLYLDMSSATLEWYALLGKYMRFEHTLPVDGVMMSVRMVKSPYEIEIMKRAGREINNILNNIIPELFCAGISEAELGAKIYAEFIKRGYHGVTRFSMKNADVVMGHIGFGKSTIYPSVFNGASGIVGLCSAAPVLGSREIKLCCGDLVYIDLGFGIEGYNVDRTLIYTFGEKQSDYVCEAHLHCLELERLAASMLKAGNRPSDIYEKVLSAVKPEFRDCFMGSKNRRVPFIGHGVGLYVDELPVLAKGFDEPLEPNMTIAIEPKIGITDIGMVGSENTYLITENGAECITGAPQELVAVMVD